MFGFVFNFWNTMTLAFFASVLLVSYRLTWWLARTSEGLIAGMTRTGMHQLARTLLVAMVDYDAATYQQSRFIVWNQVQVRFALLWGCSILIALLIFFLRIRDVVWMPWALVYVTYRLLTLWPNPPRPPIYTGDTALKSLIHDVNERKRQQGRVSTPHLIRQWDYLDQLFAGTT